MKVEFLTGSSHSELYLMPPIGYVICNIDINNTHNLSGNIKAHTLKHILDDALH